MDVVKGSQIIVIGAGPAGLGVAIGLAHQGMAVIVLEQQKILGSIRRGETIRADRSMEEILGPGFFDHIAIRRVNKRRYWSHSGQCNVDRIIKNPNIIISWPVFIHEIASIAERSGVHIITDCQVERLIEQPGGIQDVVAKTNRGSEVFPASTVFSCGGCFDPVFRQLGSSRAGIDMAILKYLVKGYTGPDDRLEYHFHLCPAGLIVGAMFPRGQGEAEFILLNTSSKNDVKLSLNTFCNDHPAFARLLNGIEVSYELHSSIPMGGMLYPFSPRPGLVMVGDVLGHVQARGGSGIRVSFLIGYTAGTLAANVVRAGGWSEENRTKFEKALIANPQVRSLRLHNFVYSRLRKLFFSTLRTPEDMDRRWPLLEVALR